jgi:hypothetical protein
MTERRKVGAARDPTLVHITLIDSIGEMTEIGGVPCYVATPTVNYPKDKAVLFLTDAHGMLLVNNKASLPFCRFVHYMVDKYPRF